MARSLQGQVLQFLCTLCQVCSPTLQQRPQSWRLSQGLLCWAYALQETALPCPVLQLQMMGCSTCMLLPRKLPDVQHLPTPPSHHPGTASNRSDLHCGPAEHWQLQWDMQAVLDQNPEP